MRQVPDSASGVWEPWMRTQPGEREVGEKPHRKRSGDPGQWEVENESAVCLSRQKGLTTS